MNELYGFNLNIEYSNGSPSHVQSPLKNGEYARELLTTPC